MFHHANEGDTAMPTEATPTEADLLADLLDGKVDPADVPAELAELASLADAVSEHITLVPPTDAFREALREQVAQSAGSAGGAGGAAGSTGGGGAGGVATTTATTATTAASSGGMSAIIAGIAATAVLASGTVAVADRSGPGDPLAGLDRGLESVQLAIADDQRDAELLVDFAAERVLEAVDLVDTEVVTSLLQLSQGMLDDALALAVELDLDVEELVQPYAAALLTLASRTDDSVVAAQLAPLFDEVGLDTSFIDWAFDSDASQPTGGEPTSPSTGAGGDDESGADEQPGDDATTGSQEGLDDAVDDASDDVDDTVDDVTDGVDDAVDDVTDGVDDAVDDTTDGVDDTVDDVTDGVDDAVDDVTDGVDDAVDDTTDTVDDTADAVDDTADELGDTTDGLLGD